MAIQSITLRGSNMREAELSPATAAAIEAKKYGLGSDAYAYQEKIFHLFRLHLSGHRGLVESSLDNAMGQVRRFARHVEKPIWNWEKDDVTHFIAFKKEEVDLSVGSQALYFTYLRILQNWLFSDKGLRNEIHQKFGVQVQEWIGPENSIPIRRRGRKAKKATNALNNEEFLMMMKEFDAEIALAFASGSKSAYPLARDKVMTVVLYEYGLRVSEACDLHIYQFQEDKRYPQFGKYACIYLVGKGGVEAGVHALDPNLVAVLEWYEEYIRPHFLSINTENPHLYFYSERGGALTDEQVRRRLASVGKNAGIAKKVTPHVCGVHTEPMRCHCSAQLEHKSN